MAYRIEVDTEKLKAGLKETIIELAKAKMAGEDAADKAALDKKTLVDWDKRYLWHPFTQMQDWLAEDPVIIERGEGCYLIDIDGNRYIDGVASMWANVHGHNHPDLNTALKTQIDKNRTYYVAWV